MKIQQAIYFALFAVLLASCSKPSESFNSIDLDKLKYEFQKIEDTYAAAEKAKDVEAVVSYYSQDAVSYARNTEPAIGIIAIRDKIRKQLKNNPTGNYNVYKIIDLFAEGNVVIEISSCTTFNAKNEEVLKGYLLSCFQKREGEYKCIREMIYDLAPEGNQ